MKPSYLFNHLTKFDETNAKFFILNTSIQWTYKLNILKLFNLNLFRFKFNLLEAISLIPLIQFNWFLFRRNTHIIYLLSTLCIHNIQVFLICLNLNLIQTSTYYDLCCSIPFHVILFAYWIIWNILSVISTHLSYWHDIHLEFIMYFIIIFYSGNSLSVNSLEFTFHLSPSSTSTPISYQA